jgi:uncharacterized protein DUF6650
VDFRDIARRLSGISTPIGGISWQPPSETEKQIARRLITYLEDRRVLYDPHEVEVLEHCVASVLQIRAYLTRTLGSLGEDSHLAKTIRAMRAACRRFLQRNAGMARDPHGAWGVTRWIFDQSLGEMRGTFGICIAELAVQHNLNIEEPLAQILPPDQDAG